MVFLSVTVPTLPAYAQLNYSSERPATTNNNVNQGLGAAGQQLPNQVSPAPGQFQQPSVQTPTRPDSPFAGQQTFAPAVPDAPVPLPPDSQELLEPEKEDLHPPQLRTCKAEDVVGVWRLVRLLQPENAGVQARLNKPLQFLWLTPKRRRYAGQFTRNMRTTDEIKRAVYDYNKGKLWQYNVNENGVMYVYLNQDFSYSYYCAISQEAVGIYRIGDMLLTRTDNSATKTFELYRKIISP